MCIFPPPQHYEYLNNEICSISENSTINLPPLQKSPSRLQLTAPLNILSPRRRRTLGSPSRQANPSLSPVKSQTNLRAAAANVERKHTSMVVTRGNSTGGGMIKLAARNTFRGRENDVVDWDKECEVTPEGEMPSPFIRRRGVSRTSAGLSRS